jgi:hypothetical protein
MPVYSSYKLQSLNISCFRTLKRLYSKVIEDLMRSYIIHVSKDDFFPAFHIVYLESMTESNIKGGFRGVGLVL